MHVTQKSSMDRYSQIAATVLVTEDVSEVILFGGLRRGSSISETTILRLGKLCPTSNLCHSYFGNSHVIKVINTF